MDKVLPVISSQILINKCLILIITLMPKISIILPTYNTAELLPRSIASVINQTYSDWELIIWDDGSTDNTSEIVRSFNDERIKYRKDDNHGAAYARNRAIEKARGEYLAFLDSDDEWSKEKLTTQARSLDTHRNIGFLFSDFLNINIVRYETRTSFKENEKALQLLKTEQLNDDLFIIKSGIPESLLVGNYIATDSILLRREILHCIGEFNEGLRNSEDFELWWRISLSDACIAFHKKNLLTRYKPADSLSSPSLEASKSTLKALDLCAQEAKKHCRNDLLPHLDNLYRNTWQHLLINYGMKHENLKMIHAFHQSLKYGFRLGSVKLLIKGLFNLFD